MRFHLFILCLWALPLLAQAIEAEAACKRLAKVLGVNQVRDTRPELCFSGQFCSTGGVPVSDFLLNANDPEQLRIELEAYSNWLARIERVPMIGKKGELVRLSRRVGTASCVRDTYLLKTHGKYTLIESEDLDLLSGEGANCGNDEVWLLRGNKHPRIALRDNQDLQLFFLDKDFSLKPICRMKSAFGN